MNKGSSYKFHPKPSNKFGKKWTPAEEEDIKIAYSAGKTASDLEQLCGRTANAIQMRMMEIAIREVNAGSTVEIVATKYKLDAAELKQKVGEKKESNDNDKKTPCTFPECKYSANASSVSGKYCIVHMKHEQVTKFDINDIKAEIMLMKADMKVMMERLETLLSRK
jgi:hypothetical protein